MPKGRPNPVAAEIRVSVTGARSGGTGESRDLFTEETVTVLVFKDGAVIQLSAGVAVGQLLFLTNKKSNQEVVCQVLHKRSYKPTICYVELQFTEEKQDFWGVAFPEGRSGGSELKAAADVEAEETAEDSARLAVEPHREEDVEQLKKEVQALRERLLEMEKQSAAEGAEKAEAAAREAAEREAAQAPQATVSKAKLELASVNEPSPEPAAKTAEEAKARETTDAARGGVSKAKLELAQVNEPNPEPPAKAAEEVKAPLMPAAKDKDEPARPVIRMALPTGKQETKKVQEMAKDTAAAFLPNSALDFSRMSADAAHLAETGPESIYKTSDPIAERKRILGMSVFLVLLLVGGAWYGKWWQYLPKKKTPAISRQSTDYSQAKKEKTNAETQSAPRSAEEERKAQAPAEEVHSQDKKTQDSPVHPEKVVGMPKSAKSAKDGPPTNEKSKPALGEVQSSKLKVEREVKKTQADSRQPTANSKGGQTQDAALQNKAGALGEEVHSPQSTVHSEDKKTQDTAEHVKGGAPTPKKVVATNKVVEASAMEPVASGAPVIAAKLLKAANPVYPPDAMRNYITGDVRAEVAVDATGRVGEVKVISGPQALRAAAVEALKNYKYAPATQGGKAVGSKAMATVKFWFNP